MKSEIQQYETGGNNNDNPQSSKGRGTSNSAEWPTKDNSEDSLFETQTILRHLHPETDLEAAGEWLRRHDPDVDARRKGEWLCRLVEEEIIARDPIDTSNLYGGGRE